MIDPLGRCTTASWDRAGRQTLRHDPRDLVTTYSHDAEDRLTVRHYPDGSRVTFTFDEVGSRIRMEDAIGRYTYTYDARDQKSVVTDCFFQTITCTYDALGQRATTTAPGSGRFTYSYDALSRLEWLVNPFGERSTFSYDAGSRRTLSEAGRFSRIRPGKGLKATTQPTRIYSRQRRAALAQNGPKQRYNRRGRC